MRIKITNENHAARHARASLMSSPVKIKTLIVSENGDVMANCDVNEACKALEKDGVGYFILAGEKTKKAKEKE